MRLRAQAGYSLIETMLAAAIALVILSAALLTIGRAFTLNMRVTERVEATQRARLAMDAITRQLRSAVCPDPFTAALVSANSDAVTFFVDLGDGSKPVAKHTLTFAPTARTITEARYDGTGGDGSPLAGGAARPGGGRGRVRPDPADAQRDHAGR